MIPVNNVPTWCMVLDLYFELTLQLFLRLQRPVVQGLQHAVYTSTRLD